MFVMLLLGRQHSSGTIQVIPARSRHRRSHIIEPDVQVEGLCSSGCLPASFCEHLDQSWLLSKSAENPPSHCSGVKVGATRSRM